MSTLSMERILSISAQATRYEKNASKVFITLAAGNHRYFEPVREDMHMIGTIEAEDLRSFAEELRAVANIIEDTAIANEEAAENEPLPRLEWATTAA